MDLHVPCFFAQRRPWCTIKITWEVLLLVVYFLVRKVAAKLGEYGLARTREVPLLQPEPCVWKSLAHNNSQTQLHSTSDLHSRQLLAPQNAFALERAHPVAVAVMLTNLGNAYGRAGNPVLALCKVQQKALLEEAL
eukprot:1276078-Amphidinium_carterae.1